MIELRFMRRPKSHGDLTGLRGVAASRPRGRPSELSDAQLHNRRNQLVQIFEGAWGEIGWELQRCKQVDDLIRIFSPIANPESWVGNVMELFCRPCSESASGATLRKVRAEWGALAEPSRAADESNRRAKEQLQQVASVLTQAKGRSRRIVKRALKWRRKEFWKTSQLYQSLYDRDRQLAKRLRHLEAAFARQEFLRFLKSRRYSLTPLALANAAAGLPHMGWRQSMRRSVKTPCTIAEGGMYQIFKAIRYLAAKATKRTVDGLVISFEDSISSLPSRYNLAKIELARNWFYLERALRRAFRAKPHPKAWPFEITKLYFKQLGSTRSQVDVVLAEQAKLMLSKPRPQTT